MKPGNRFYVWLIPLLWAGCSLLHFRFPGDEYAMYALSSMAGAWIAFVVRVGDIHNPLIPLSVAGVGAIVMAVPGLLMDWARIRRKMWLVLLVVSFLSILVASIDAYPSLMEALSQNGSWWAYVFFSFNMGLYLSVVLSFAGKGAEVLWRSTRSEAKSLRSDDA